MMKLGSYTFPKQDPKIQHFFTGNQQLLLY